MIQRSSFLVHILFFYICFILMLPLKNIYFEMESLFKQQGVVISNEQIESNLISLKMKESIVYYNQVKAADIKEIDFKSFLLFTRFNLLDIQLDNQWKGMFPYSLENVTVTHSMFDPFIVNFNAVGAFGRFIGSFDIFDKKVKVELITSENLIENKDEILKMMDEIDGKYIYEYQF